MGRKWPHSDTTECITRSDGAQNSQIHVFFEVPTWGREASAKGLEVLYELLPATRSVGFLTNPRNNPLSELQTRDVLTAGRTIGVENSDFAREH
jgi:hypothetical protein